MQALLEHFITQSTVYSLMAVVLVAFLESLALVGLILPGTVLMAGLGALIGSGELSFWHAWLAGIVGCLLGDWISFWLGWRFKKPLHRWSFRRILSAACCGHRFTSCLGFWRARRSIFQPECRAASLNGCCWRRRYFCGLVAGCAGGYGAVVKRLTV